MAAKLVITSLWRCTPSRPEAGSCRSLVAPDPDLLGHEGIPTPAHFFREGRSVAVCGSKANGVSRCFAHDLASATTRAVTPEGTDHGRVSPDGTAVVARSADGRYRLYFLEGSREPVPVPGLGAGDQIISWRSDGRSLLVFRPAEIQTRVDILEVATGRRTLLIELAPAHRAGALRFYEVSFSADERSYAYSFTRKVDALYAVSNEEGSW